MANLNGLGKFATTFDMFFDTVETGGDRQFTIADLRLLILAVSHKNSRFAMANYGINHDA